MDFLVQSFKQPFRAGTWRWGIQTGLTSLGGRRGSSALNLPSPAEKDLILQFPPTDPCLYEPLIPRAQEEIKHKGKRGREGGWDEVRTKWGNSLSKRWDQGRKGRRVEG